MKTFIIQQNDQGQRLDKFLTKSVPLLPKSLLYKSIRKKRIKVNGKRCELNYKLCLGDQVDLYLNDEFFSSKERPDFLTVPAQVDIVYEDSQILLANKPQGLVVHEDNDNTMDTLIHRVQHYLYQKGEYRPQEELSFAPALCNRIDRNTCGIVIVAKTAEALRILNEKIKNRELTKKYLCLVAGTPAPKHGVLTHYLEKDSAGNMVTLYDRPRPGAKTAITEYQVLESRGGLSLVEVNLKTGRTHQIRAHMAHMGHPLLGDGKYGLHQLNNQYGIKHQALCSYQLTFSFTTDAGALNYLKGKTFTVQNIWFVDQFRAAALGRERAAQPKKG